MKIVIIGGHLSPALSVIDALPKDTKILFIGRKYAFEGDKALSLEYRAITFLNIPFVGLSTGRLQRKLTKYTFSSLLKLPFGFVKSFLTLVKFRPDVVIGFGGYVSIPVVFCAYLFRIPVVIHEQTLEAGFANRLLARLATKICISWPTSMKYFPKEKIVFTGNPIRKFDPDQIGTKFEIESNKNLPAVYITGGSSGSHFINVLVEGCIRDLLRSYNVIHQTGDAQEFRDFDRLEKFRSSLPAKLSKRYTIIKFADPFKVGNFLEKASLVVSRSGINTITELLYFEKPSLLIPFPVSQNNEQLKNAVFLEKMGLGKVLRQDILSPKKLFQEISLMFHNIDSFRIHKEFLENKSNKNAAQKIIQVINYVHKIKTREGF